MAVTAFEPSGNVTIMATVFSAVIAIDVKLFAALRADEVVDSFSLDLTEMTVPPCVTAFVAAEPFSFLFGNLPYLSTAIFAMCDFLRNLGGRSYIAADVVPAAKGFYGIKRYAKFLGNCAITVPGRTHFGNLDFLAIGHNLSAPSERYRFDFPLTYQIKI